MSSEHLDIAVPEVLHPWTFLTQTNKLFCLSLSELGF